MSTEKRRISGIVELAKQFVSVPGSGFRALVGLSELDDCAVIPIATDIDLVIGSDFVRGEDFYLFREGLLSYEDLGYYLVGANASDLAAMGATPIGIVVVARYSPSMTDENFSDVMHGVLRACSDMSIPLLGGDSGGYPLSVLSGAAIGSCPRGSSLLRSGGKPGDILFASGDFGTAGATLFYFTQLDPKKRILPKETEADLLLSWQRIQPALEQGRLLVENRLACCGIDTSDGLKVSCEQIAEASRLDVIVDASRVPISALAKRVAELSGRDPLEVALGDSVDFRLVFSVPEGNAKRTTELFRDKSLSLFEIGRLVVTSATPAAYINIDGKLSPLPGTGWTQ